jgi:NAD(P)-dependent dehydrogenase (short-subunit alcohol dehydrogenase family)
MGRSAALRLGREGANVVVAGRRMGELTAVADAIVEAGGTALAIPTDVSDERQVEALIAQIVSTFGGLDLAWNNAGVLGKFGSVRHLDLADFDAMMAVNLRGVFICLKHELAAMTAHTGCAIVNTSSWTAHGAMPGLAAYAASKAAIDAMVRTVAVAIGTEGIRINNVSPGLIDTAMAKEALSTEEAVRPLLKHTPLQRVGQPEDVADAVLWLLSDDARFVTGQSILVDGGFTIGGPRPWLNTAVSRHAV